jgi:hypothetical protein
MKTKFWNLLSLIMVSALISNCGGASEEETNEKRIKDSLEFAKSVPASLTAETRYGGFGPGEVQPDFEATILDATLSRKTIQATATYFRLNGTALALKAAELDSAQLRLLKKTAMTLTSTSGPCSDSLPGIKIIYARTGSTLKLYYQPLLFCVTGPRVIQPNGRVTRQSKIWAEGGYYVYSGGVFNLLSTPAEIAAKDAAIVDFQKATTGLQVLDNGTFRNYILTSDSDPAGDVKSVVCPLQQLLDVCAAGGSGKVILWNACESIGYQSTPKLIKQTQVFSTDNVAVTGTTLSIPQNAAFSDLVHICPICIADQFNFFVE